LPQRTNSSNFCEILRGQRDTFSFPQNALIAAEKSLIQLLRNAARAAEHSFFPAERADCRRGKKSYLFELSLFLNFIYLIGESHQVKLVRCYSQQDKNKIPRRKNPQGI